MSSRGGDPEVLTTPGPGEDHLWPDVLPDGNAVLFTIRSGLGAENSQIAVLDLGAGTHRVLIERGSQVRYASTGHVVYGVEGRLFAAAFDRTRLVLTDESALILDGVVPTAAGAVPFGLSDNGTLAYVSGALLENNRILALVDREGRIEVLDPAPKPYLSPRMSPDGNRIAVQVDEDNRSSIWVYELSGESQIRELTQGGDNTRPVWTPDSERVTFASNRDGNWGIYWQRADGGAVAQRLTSAEEGVQHWPESWSSDGQTLSFAVVDGEARGLWMLSLAGPQIRSELFYDEEGFHQNGSLFSPDGNWLAYYSNESNSDNQIWVQSVPRSGVRHPITFDGGVFPLWSINGDELIYRRPGTAAIDGTRLIAVDLPGDDTFAPGVERPLLITGFSVFGTYRDYDITPDGERFLMVFSEDYAESGGVPRRQVNVVLNWFEELLDRVPAP